MQPPPEHGSRKIQIQFSSATLERIDVLMKTSRRRTVAEVVRDALQLYDWCRRQIADGYVIAAVKDNRRREVVLPFEIT